MRRGRGNKERGRERCGAPPVRWGGRWGPLPPSGYPGPLPQASPFMVRRRARGGGSQGAGRAEGREARAAPGSARSGVGPEPAGARAAQVSGAGVGGLVLPSFPPHPRYVQVAARAARVGAHPAPSWDPSPGAPGGGRRDPGRGGLSCLSPLSLSPEWGEGWCPCPGAGRQGQGWAGRKLPHKEDSVLHMERIKVPGSAPR